MENTHFDVIILGGGAAGLTAGIYLSRAKMKTLIVNEGTAGGQMVLTHEIANYPGIESIGGYMLGSTMRQQAQTFGATIFNNSKILSLDLKSDVKSIELARKGQFTSNAVILASGGRSRPLNVPGEDKFKGRGISYCATCDGDFFQDKEIIVVGGGNSALEEAVSLTKYAKKVTIVHQFDHFQALEHYIDEAKANPKIHFVMESEIAEFFGDDKLTHVQIKNMKTNDLTEMNIEGVFVLIGYIPNTDMFEGIVELTDRKEIITTRDMETNIPGVFAAGDCTAKKYRQVTTAVADGTIAGLAAVEYVSNK
ncbi:MAG: thioredoxin-disulfide reductase [Bacteroidetes bacterium]|nr:thioredoxin-disulfide reductase [Bacteroidota bacterium]MBU1117136.1 thioredoxin-disulfide reductase [Bacteroidota bacterium]MBU1796818.1 thioredoxin-disulfide reductase [Bacteroidota bacterium]